MILQIRLDTLAPYLFVAEGVLDERIRLGKEGRKGVERVLEEFGFSGTIKERGEDEGHKKGWKEDMTFERRVRWLVSVLESGEMRARREKEGEEVKV